MYIGSGFQSSLGYTFLSRWFSHIDELPDDIRSGFDGASLAVSGEKTASSVKKAASSVKKGGKTKKVKGESKTGGFEPLEGVEVKFSTSYFQNTKLGILVGGSSGN